MLESAEVDYRDFRAGDVRHSKLNFQDKTGIGYDPQYEIDSGLDITVIGF